MRVRLHSRKTTGWSYRRFLRLIQSCRWSEPSVSSTPPPCPPCSQSLRHMLDKRQKMAFVNLKVMSKPLFPHFVSAFGVLCVDSALTCILCQILIICSVFFSASWQQPAAEPFLLTQTQKRRECCGGSGKTWRCYDRNEKPTHVPINLLHSTMPHWKKGSIYSQYSGSTVSFMSLKKESGLPHPGSHSTRASW